MEQEVEAMTSNAKKEAAPGEVGRKYERGSKEEMYAIVDGIIAGAVSGGATERAAAAIVGAYLAGTPPAVTAAIIARNAGADE